MTSDQPYVLGHKQREIRRLELQDGLLRPPTSRLLREVGLGEGMSVLDIGTGAGDVAMLAADLVGPGGSVVGIDRSAAVIARARERSAAAGLAKLRVEQADLAEAGHLGHFDLVVGRYVLVFQPDKVAFLRSAAAFVRPGGRLAFLEPSVTVETRVSTPPAPLYDQGIAKVIEAFGIGGADVDVGGRFAGLFQDAGLPEPELFCEVPLGGPSSVLPEWMSSTLQSLAPALEAAGRLDTLDVTTLAARVREAATRTRSQLSGPPSVGAWTRVG